MTDQGDGSKGVEAPDLEGYAQIVEHAPLGIYVVQDGLIRYGNRWLREFSGYGLEDLPRPALDVIHPDDRAMVAEEMRRRVTGAPPARGGYPVRFLKRSGAFAHVDLIAQVVTWEGRPAIQGSIVDTAEKVEAERRLRGYTAHLEEANRYRQIFGDIISHDLLNPVWVVQNYLRMVRDEGVSGRQRTLLDRAEATLERARDVLQDARTYLRTQEPRQLAAERLDLGQLIRDAADGLRPQCERAGQRVEIRLPGPISVTGNPSLREVFTNLIANAIEHNPRGEAVEVVAGGADLVRVEVRDRGPGIPPADRERIFRRFERLAGDQGLGLGLSIVKVLVELHGGRVWVEDREGGGSVFAVELPTALRL